MSRPTSRATLVRLRRAVVAGEMTSAEAAASVGIPRGTLASRWRAWGIVHEIPMVSRHTARNAVVELFDDQPLLTDKQASAELALRGIALNTSAVRCHRVVAGIGTRVQRMSQRSLEAPRAGKVPDAELIEARQMVVNRESTTRRQATRLGVASQTLYNEWHRLGLVQARASGPAGDTPDRPCKVRDEVAAHLLEYPWMAAQDIADSMTADGYRISKRSVSQHLRNLKKCENSNGDDCERT